MLQATVSKLLSAIQASIRTHKGWWAGGGGAAVVAIAAAVIVFGGFFGPSGKTICTVALEHARDYGVVPNNTALANTEAKSTDVRNRRVCTAQAGDDTYNITADVITADTAELKCRNKDVTKNKECIALYSVARSDGLTTYQVRQVPDDDADAAVDTGTPGGEAQNAGDENEIQPATGTHSGDAGQQQNGAPQQQDAAPQR
jgi:hypothetical protein